MNVLYFLIPLALLLAGLGVYGFYWAVRSGQFDDVETPALRILLEEETPGERAKPREPTPSAKKTSPS